ncbi:MAG: class I SAM-dependent methyltransferase [Acidimicrobiales bacterium]
MADQLVFPVPERFRRGNYGGRRLVETGKDIVDLVCDLGGLDSLDGLDVLDYGSGYRLAQVILEYGLGVRSYCGVDIDPEMIDWLSANSPDSRLSFVHVPFRNEMYRPDGIPLTADSILPIGDRHFDVIILISVITHLNPPTPGVSCRCCVGSCAPAVSSFSRRS